jgi:peroxiredoxin Q/BCP
MLTIGSPAPAFSAPDAAGNTATLETFRGKWLALCFYPKDFTPACTAQACSLRDNYAELADLGVTVVGISGDGPAQHKNFADRYRLPYTLLSDDGTVRAAYQVPRSFLGLMAGRVTYIIDPAGIVRGVFNSQLNIKGHIAAIRRVVKGQ